MITEHNNKYSVKCIMKRNKRRKLRINKERKQNQNENQKEISPNFKQNYFCSSQYRNISDFDIKIPIPSFKQRMTRQSPVIITIILMMDDDDDGVIGSSIGLPWLGNRLHRPPAQVRPPILALHS